MRAKFRSVCIGIPSPSTPPKTLKGSGPAKETTCVDRDLQNKPRVIGCSFLFPFSGYSYHPSTVCNSNTFEETGLSCDLTGFPKSLGGSVADRPIAGSSDRVPDSSFTFARGSIGPDLAELGRLRGK